MPILNWLDRDKHVKQAETVPYRLLTADDTHSAGNAANQNKVIQGDNLEHSQWLAMMFSRLRLLRELLAEDGSIWVTIDDNEAHYLKVIIDDVVRRYGVLRTTLYKQVA